MTTVIDFDGFVDKYQSLLCDQDLRVSHIKSGTIDEFYQSVIRDATLDLSLMQTNRTILELEAIESQDELFDAFATLVEMVTSSFVKPRLQVKKDLLAALKVLPVDDVREAALLKSKNLLN
jgi:hypothetical protein